MTNLLSPFEGVDEGSREETGEGENRVFKLSIPFLARLERCHSENQFALLIFETLLRKTFESRDVRWKHISLRAACLFVHPYTSHTLLVQRFCLLNKSVFFRVFFMNLFSTKLHFTIFEKHLFLEKGLMSLISVYRNFVDVLSLKCKIIKFE